MMKRILGIIVILICTISLSAQTDSNDDKLSSKYSKKELKALKQENPDQYKFEMYCVNNAFYIANGSQKKVNENPEEYGEINIKNIDDVNFFELNIELLENNHQMFMIKGTNKVLIVKSKNHIIKELNQ